MSTAAGAAVSVGLLHGADKGILGAGVKGATKALLVAAADWVTADVYSRRLSQIQENRVSKSISEFKARAEALNESGEAVRDDGFFEAKPNYYMPDFHQIFEGVLQRVQVEYEEKKQRHLNQIHGNIGFRKYQFISAAQAYHILNDVGRLSYNHMLMLGIYATENVTQFSDESRGEETDIELLLPMQCITDLERMGYMVVKSVDRPGADGFVSGGVGRDRSNTAVFSLGDIVPRDAELTPFGIAAVKLMGLDEADRSDIEAMVKKLV